MKIIFGLIFLVLLAICTFLTQPIYRDHMEKDLLTKARTILDEEGLDQIEAKVVRHELQLTPLAAADASQVAKAIEVTDKVWGAYIPSAPPAVAPILRGASLVGTEQPDGLIVLTGEIPDEAFREQIVTKAKAIPGVSKVDDQMVVAADVATPVWGGEVSGLLENIVTTADSAKLKIDDNDLEISGVVDSDKVKSELGSVAANLPHGEANFVNGLKVEPWKDPTMRLQRNGKRYILTGELPDEETRQVMVKQAMAAAGKAEFIDRTTITKRTRPAWWGGHSATFFPKFFGQSTGPAFVSYSPGNIEVESVVSEKKSKRDLDRLAVNGLPGKVKPAVRIKLVEPIAKVEPTPAPAPAPVPETAKPDFKSLAVYFNTASSWVKASEVTKVEQAAALIKSSAGDANLTVGGYADLRGNAESNRKLSLERANSVRKKLIELGVPAERLSVEFFGEDTSEVAAADLWKSRRVEISFK